MTQKNKTAKIQFIVSMFIFGTIGIFVKNIPLSSAEVALYRALLALVPIGLYLLATKNGFSFASMRKELPLLLCSGAALGFNWILLFEAYRYTSVSVATLSYYFAPILVTAVCPILFHEKLTKKQLVCFLMATLGVILIIGTSGFTGTDTTLTGIAFGLGAACCYAIVILLNKFIKNVAGLHRTLLQFVAAIVVLLPYTACTSGFHLNILDVSGWANLLIVGFIHTGVTYCLYFSSLGQLRGQQAAILSYIDPLTAVIFSFFVLGEELTLPQIIGGILILGFALWNETQSNS